VWQCDACSERTAAKTRPERCPKCGGTVLRQDPDVLDTWFSSGLWPFATLGWPADTPDLRYFYPGDGLVTANEILFLWIARMIMLGLHFMDDVPFTDVYVAPTVMTLDGRRMSKSLGTGIDPLEMADGRGYGADAVRFALISRCSQGQQDLRFSEKMIADVRNFTTKIWNATRFVLLNLDGFDHRTPVPRDAFGLPERWIRSRYARVARAVIAHLEAYEFDRAARVLYDFVWSEYCDWFVEMAKVDLPHRRMAVQHTLWSVLAGTMQLLHPIMPFLTEEVWQQLPHDGDSIMISRWPEPDAAWIDDGAEEMMVALIAAVRSHRSQRSELNVPPKERLRVYIRGEDSIRPLLADLARYLEWMARAKEPTVLPPGAAEPSPESSGNRIIPETVSSDLSIRTEVSAHLVSPARERLARMLSDFEAELARIDKRLADRDYVQRAPAEVINRDRDRATELTGLREKLRNYLHALD